MHGSSITAEKPWALVSDEVLNCLAELACRSLEASDACISYFTSEQQGRSVAYRSTGVTDTPKIELRRSVCWRVFAGNEAILLDQAEAGEDSEHDPRDGAASLEAYLGVPIRDAQGTAVGALCVFDHRQRQWGQADLRLLAALADASLAQTERDAEKSARQHAERALRESEGRFSIVADHLPGVVFERRKTGPESWTYRFFGTTRRNLVGEDDAANSGGTLGFIHAEDRDRVRDTLTAATRAETNLDLTFRAAVPGDATRWLRSQSVVRHERDGSAVWNGLCFDITDLVTAREAAEAARAAHDMLLVDVNHELRTPLQAILGFAALLKQETRPDVVRGHAEIIQSSAQSLLSIVNQLLDLASGEENAARSVHRQRTDVHALADRCHGMVTPLAREKGISSSLLVDPDVPLCVLADGPKIQQILVNLLNNAIKFTDAGSIALHVSRVDGGLRFSVSDTGIGIAEDKIDLLFQRFYRLEPVQRSTRGSGLGLAIAKQLVETMDGTIGVASTPGAGTTFWFQVDAETLVEAWGESAEDGLQPSLGARVLVADDLDLNRKLIADMLALEGHEVDCVNDGAAAVRAATDHSYDLILMDMIMPGMDGIAATRVIRALPSPACNVPIIALTAHSFKEQLDSCLAAGMDATLTKPMSLETLATTVRDWTQNRSKAA